MWDEEAVMAGVRRLHSELGQVTEKLRGFVAALGTAHEAVDKQILAIYNFKEEGVDPAILNEACAL